MEDKAGSKKLREIIRVLEQKLGVLDNLQSCCGVTLAQCHVIVEIGRSGTLSLNDLAGNLGLDKSTLSRTVNYLVNDGLVSREPDPDDRRYIVIALTEKGRDVFRGIEENMNQYFDRVYKSLPENKREQVLESLELLVKSFAENKCCKMKMR